MQSGQNKDLCRPEIAKKKSYYWVKLFKMKIARLSIEYTFIIYKILNFFLNLTNEKIDIYMVLKYACRVGNKYTVQSK